MWWPEQAIENKLDYIHRAAVGASFIDGEPNTRSRLAAKVALVSAVVEQAKAFTRKKRGSEHPPTA